MLIVNLALGLSAAVAQSSTVLEADAMLFDETSGQVEASGNTELTAQGNRLTTDFLRFNRVTETVTIPGAMTLHQDDGTKIDAIGARLNTGLDEGDLTDLSLTMPQAGRIRAATASQAPDEMRLSDANFTSCAPCENPQDDPLWQIQASRITYDRTGQNVFYTHPRLEIYGTPVFYLPYMAHAGPEVDRRSGFLAPRIASSGDFGPAVETPYFFDMAPNYDLTVTPRISEKQDPFVTTQWRHLTRYGSYELTGYAHNPSGEISDDTSRATRTGLTGSGQFRLADWDMSFLVQDASDDLFFKRYDISDESRLTNRLRFSRDWANQSVSIEAHAFRNTVNAETTSTVDMIVPSLTHQVFFDTQILGGNVSMTNRLRHDIRNLGTDVTHAGSQIDWQWQHTTRGGFVLSARNRLALDAYQYNPQDGQSVEAEELLSANAAALTVAYPLRRVTSGDTQTLTPQAQIVLATDNEDYDKVPFISGSSVSLSRAQLFSPLAMKDEASRLNFGITHKLELLTRLETEVFIGQSVNLSDRSYNDADGVRSGYGDDRSNLLADIALRTGALSLSQQARFDSAGSELLRSESKIALAFKNLQFGLGHSFYEAGQNGANVLHEATARLGWSINQYWSLDASMRENLETDARVEALANLTYEDECTLLTLSIERDYSEVAGIEADTSINLTFTLKTIGGTP